FAELHDRARAVAIDLAAQVRPGGRVLLVFQPGLNFIVGFFGCVLAGLIPVPMMAPRRNSSRDATASIVADCEPQIVLTDRAFAASSRGSALQRFTDVGIECLPLAELGLTAPRGAPSLPGA